MYPTSFVWSYNLICSIISEDVLTLTYKLEPQSNLYIKDTQGNLKCTLMEKLHYIYRLKLFALFINGKIVAALYRQ